METKHRKQSWRTFLFRDAGIERRRERQHGRHDSGEDQLGEHVRGCDGAREALGMARRHGRIRRDVEARIRSPRKVVKGSTPAARSILCRCAMEAQVSANARRMASPLGFSGCGWGAPCTASTSSPREDRRDRIMRAPLFGTRSAAAACPARPLTRTANVALRKMRDAPAGRGAVSRTGPRRTYPRVARWRGAERVGLRVSPAV